MAPGGRDVGKQNPAGNKTSGNELAQGLWPIPIWIPQSSFAFGAILFLVAVVDEFVIVARGGVPTFVRLANERHAKGDFSSDV